MLYAIKNIVDLEKLEELASLQHQVKDLRLQNRLGHQNFHEVEKTVFEPPTKTIKDTSEDITKTMTETSEENDRALTNLNNKLLEIKNDGGTLAPYSLSPLSKTTNLEHTSQLKLVKSAQSNQISDLLIYKTIRDI